MPQTTALFSMAQLSLGFYEEVLSHRNYRGILVPMLKTHHHFFRLLFQLTDGLTVIGAWALAYFIRFQVRPGWLPTPENEAATKDYVVVAFALVLIWFLSLQINGAYKSWRASKLGLEILNILKSSALAFVVFVALQHFVARESLSRATLGLFFCVRERGPGFHAHYASIDFASAATPGLESALPFDHWRWSSGRFNSVKTSLKTRAWFYFVGICLCQWRVQNSKKIGSDR
jgi:hypothetical protein